MFASFVLKDLILSQIECCKFNNVVVLIPISDKAYVKAESWVTCMDLIVGPQYKSVLWEEFKKTIW